MVRVCLQYRFGEVIFCRPIMIVFAICHLHHMIFARFYDVLRTKFRQRREQFCVHRGSTRAHRNVGRVSANTTGQ